MSQDAIELTAPDISRYAAGTHGVPYVHTFDSGKPGPHVMVNALTHEMEEYYASIIFVNASPLATNLILLNSIFFSLPQWARK